MRKRTKTQKFLSNLYAVLIFLFMYAPILVLIVYSFNKSRISARWTGFTFDWYLELFNDAQIMDSMYYTIVIALLSSTIALVIGTLASVKINEMTRVKKSIVLGVNSLPVVNPDIVTGIALMSLFLFLGLERGFVTMLIAHITFNIPFVVLAVLPKVKQMPPSLMEAAIDLGATYPYAFRKVLLPQISSGMVAGWLIAFTMSIDDFVISFFTTGSGVSNLSIQIYSMTKRGFTPKINAISTIMFVAVLILLLLVNKLQDKGDYSIF